MELYGKKYGFYVLIPLALTVLFLFMVFAWPGIQKGIDLTGGTLIIVRAEKPVDAKLLEQSLSSQYPLTDLKVTAISSPTGYGVTVQFGENKDFSNAALELNKAKELLEKSPNEAAVHAFASIDFISKYLQKEELPPKTISAVEAVQKADELYSKAMDDFLNAIRDEIKEKSGLKELFFQVKQIGPALGEAFFQNAIFVTIIAGISVIIIIFLFFRELIPSAAVIFAGLFDVLTALAGMSVMGITLSLNSIPALLMLFGYSIDTDILLTTRLLKRKDKTARERAVDSMKTGLTMTITTIAAVIAMISLSYLYQIVIVFEIGVVLLFGLLGDIISTWLMNAPILLWFVKRKKKGE